MFYVATFFALLMSVFCLLYIRERVLFREARIKHTDLIVRISSGAAHDLQKLEDEVEECWNRAEGYRSNADIYKAERDDALRCLDLVLTEQAARMSRELDNAYDSLSMVLAENEKLRVA